MNFSCLFSEISPEGEDQETHTNFFTFTNLKNEEYPLAVILACSLSLKLIYYSLCFEFKNDLLYSPNQNLRHWNSVEQVFQLILLLHC